MKKKKPRAGDEDDTSDIGIAIRYFSRVDALVKEAQSNFIADMKVIAQEEGDKIKGILEDGAKIYPMCDRVLKQHKQKYEFVEMGDIMKVGGIADYVVDDMKDLSKDIKEGVWEKGSISNEVSTWARGQRIETEKSKKVKTPASEESSLAGIFD